MHGVCEHNRYCMRAKVGQSLMILVVQYAIAVVSTNAMRLRSTGIPEYGTLFRAVVPYRKTEIKWIPVCDTGMVKNLSLRVHERLYNIYPPPLLSDTYDTPHPTSTKQAHYLTVPALYVPQNHESIPPVTYNPISPCKYNIQDQSIKPTYGTGNK